ncbi:GntR family transcriptional regulator, partial [Lactobacillus crispatus]|uniref:FCD domain-containing protein n=1 Tax=Lactobacillus crispatus TaxID=47770 RepID=UPI00105ED688
AFHGALIAACESKVLLGFCSQLSARANRYRRLSITVPDIPRDVRTEHRLIFAATIQRDAMTATDLLQDHFEKTAQMVDELLRHRW